MSSSAFQQTPLFQLNIMIGLCQPTFPDLDPILHRYGFELLFISPRIRTPATVTAASTQGLLGFAVSKEPRPDLLLIHGRNKVLVPLECKLSSFPLISDQARQTATLLTFTGSHIAVEVGLDHTQPWSAVICFAISAPAQADLEKKIETLAGQLRAVGITPASATSLGIEVRQDGIYLHFADPTVLQFAAPPVVKVKRLTPGEDPLPLLLIDLDPSINGQDPAGRQALGEKLRASFVRLIARQLHRGTVTILWEDIMVDAISVWGIWQEPGKKSLLRAFKKEAAEFLNEMAKRGATISREQNSFTIAIEDVKTRVKVEKYLLGADIRRERIDLQQASQTSIDEYVVLEDRDRN